MNKKLDIVFVNTNSSKKVYQDLSIEYSAIEPPFWSLLLAETCRRKGYSVAIIDAIVENLTHEQTANRVIDLNPRFCCFVTYGSNPNSSTTFMTGVYEVAENIWQGTSNLLSIISVGNHTAALPLEVLSNKYIDYVCINEGVYAILKLLAGFEYKDIPGLGWKNKKELILNNGIGSIVPQERMDIDLPGYAWDLLPYKEKPFDLYRSHNWHAEYKDELRSPFASIYSSLGCLFKCSFCLLKGTKIILSRNRNTQIENLKIGDKLIGWNEQKLCLEETEVLKTVSRKINKIYKIKLYDGKTVCATAEHPFYINNQWIKVKDLKIGDKVLVIDGYDKTSFRMKIINPMFNKETQEKVSKTAKQNFQDGRINPYLCTENGKKEISKIAKKRMLSDQNPMYKQENKEKASKRFSEENNPQWNGGTCIKLKPYYLNKNRILRKNIKKRDNYTCQECGQTEGKIDCHHIDYNNLNNQQSNLITLCASCHMKTNHDRDFWQKRYTQIMLDKSIDCPHYVRIESIEELNGQFIVYNIECSPCNNYFAENILTHNCMINLINRTNSAEKTVSADSNTMRFWSPEHMIKIFDELVLDYGISTIRILDEMFFLNKKYYEPLLTLLKERGYGKDLRMWTYARVDTVNERFLELFKDGGVKWLALGIEAANQNIRREIYKGKFQDINIRDVVKQIKDHGMYAGCNYIFGHPEETMENMQETLDLALELNGEFSNFYTAMALPGSPLYYEAKNNGWLLPSTPEGWSFHSYECQPLPTKYLTPEEVLRFRDKAWHIYFESPSFQNLVKEKFGNKALQHIQKQTKIKLKRKILGD